MSGGCAVLVRNFFPERSEYLLQVTRASNDHACFDNAQIEEETEVVQVAIKERVLIVPLNFQADAILETIDFVSRRVSFLQINAYLGSELLFLPTSVLKKIIDPFGDDALTPAAFKHFTPSKLEGTKYINNVSPLIWVRR